MAPPKIKCEVCGGSEFTLEAGFFFCQECNTQSQDVREEVFDEYFGTQKVSTRVLQNKSQIRAKNTGEKTQLTSWEVLNYVLKGITDELVSLGASPQLKIVTLQLWASYLRKEEIAFTSVKKQRKPKLGYAYKPSDAKIVYGLTDKQLREKSWRSRSQRRSVKSNSKTSDSEGSASTASTTGVGLTRRSILRKLSIRKKALATAEYSQMSQESGRSSLSRTLEDLDSESDVAETTSRMRITKRAKSLLSSSCGSSSASEGERQVLRKKISSEIRSVRNVTTAKVVAIINIALALTREGILLSDFIRWVEEGHISLGCSRKFLPQETKVDSHISKMMELEHMSHSKCQNLMMAMCRELDVESLPMPDLGQLADRYCLELQLPGELADMVKRLVTLVISTNKRPSSTVWNWRNCELLVMAAIVVIMKLLFYLDDCTEYRLSHTATHLNRLGEQEEDSPELLFSWSEWQHFMECRKAVVAAYHLPTRTAVYGDSMGRDTRLFIQHYTRQYAHLPKVKELHKYSAMNKDWVEVLTRCLSKLQVENHPSAEDCAIEFPASLTPLHSCTQTLLSQHAERVSSAVHILSQDFTSHSLQLCLQPDQCIDLGLASDLNIVKRVGAAAVYKVKKMSVKEKDNIVIPRYKLNQVNLTVNVVESVKKLKKKGRDPEEKSDEEHEKFLKDLEEILSDSSGEEETDSDSEFYNAPPVQEVSTNDSPLELFDTGTQYWFCHFPMTRSNVSLEEFEMFAMKTFSCSFFWLLKECSRVIKVHAQELYGTIMAIEKLHKGIVSEGDFRRRLKRKRL